MAKFEEFPNIEFFRTSESSGHTHLIFKDNSTDVVLMSSEDVPNEHTHEITVIPAQEEIVSDDTQEITQEEKEVTFRIEPSAEDNHTHELEGEDIDIKDDPNKDTRSEDEKVEETRGLFKTAKKEESSSLAWAIDSKRFYQGDVDAYFDSWSRAKLKSESRPIIVVNEAESKIDALSGHQRQNRTDIRLFPVEGGDNRVSDVYNVNIKNILDQNNFPVKESQEFINQAVMGRGNYGVFIDKNKNPIDGGDIIIKGFDIDEIVYGEHDEIDAEDLEYLAVAKWFSLDRLEKLVPEKADMLKAELDVANGDLKVDDVLGKRILDPKHPDQTVRLVELFTTDGELIRPLQKEIRVIEAWRKMFRKSTMIIHKQFGITINADGWKQEDIDAAERIQDFETIEIDTHFMRSTTIAGSTLISDETPDIGLEEFHHIPIYGKKEGSRFWGKIQPVKGLLMVVSKLYSQTVDIINRMAGQGWFYDNETFYSPKEEQDFLRTSASPGFKSKLKNITNRPIREEGARFPNEVVALLQQTSVKIREIMNAPLEFQGFQTREVSGIAMLQQIRQGLVGNEYLFDHNDLAKKRLGRLIVGLIQKNFTVERLMRVVENRNRRIIAEGQPEVKIGGIPVSRMDEVNPETGVSRREELVKLLEESLKDKNFLKYDVIVDKSKFNITTRLANAAVMIGLAQQGVPIKAQRIVKTLDFPDREEIVAELDEQEAQARQESQARISSEVQKAQIAAQGRAAARAPQQPAGGGTQPT